MPRPAAITWEDPAAAIYRGCQLCEHGAASSGIRCRHPEAGPHGESVSLCRRSGGFCGPEAKHLTFPGLNPLQPLQTLQRITPCPTVNKP